MSEYIASTTGTVERLPVYDDGYLDRVDYIAHIEGVWWNNWAAKVARDLPEGARVRVTLEHLTDDDQPA